MADSHRDEIARLEELHASHPEGRVFTHLAEAYRRAGDLARARQILDEGLTRHPGYPSAHVVLGRLLLESGETAQAGASFRRVLELDRHNVVALRSLGELAEAAGEIPQAIHYYTELSRVDPGNETLRARIRELESVAVPGDAWTLPGERSGDSAEPVGDLEAAGEPALPVAETRSPEAESTPEPAAGVEPPETAEARPGSGEQEGSLAGEWVQQDRWDRFARDDWGMVPAGPGPAADEAPDSPEPEPETPPPKALEEATDEGASTEDEGFAVPLAIESGLSRDEFEGVFTDLPGDDLDVISERPEGEIEIGLEAVSGFEGDGDAGDVAEAEDEPEPAAEVAGEFPDRAEEADVIEVVSHETFVIEFTEPSVEPEEQAGDGEEAIDEWVTETMAEVYAAQGLTERAVEVYRLLQRRHPDDTRIAGRLAELEEALAGPGVAGMASLAEAEDEDAAEAREAWLASVESAWTGAEGAVAAAAGDTLYGWSAGESESEAGGPTAGELFRALLGWRPAHRPDQNASVAAGPSSSPGTTTADAEPEAAELLLEEAVDDAAQRSAVAGSTGSVEAAFEELFGGGLARSTESQPPAAAPEPPPLPPSERLPRAGAEAESEQDLEMFRTWLRSLRK